ncbi:MAG: sensor domain-containing diguanylate cyclase [Candidatus Eremiobacteraeota bacterium]|nr:sensor domain-containing diguanylate cyclase [Candidatus Eremiobacteraeota bacterium]
MRPSFPDFPQSTPHGVRPSRPEAAPGNHMLRIIIRLLAMLIALAAGSGVARAGPVLDVRGTGDFVELTPYLELAQDPTNHRSVNEMARASFTPVGRIMLSDPHQTYWMRMRIAAGKHDPWLLTAGFRPAHADFFLPNGRGFDELRSGDELPYALRPAPAFNWIVFPLPDFSAPTTVYLRLQTSEPLVNIVAYSAERFRQDNIRDIVVIAALLSVLISLVLSSIVLFFVMRDSLYLYYAAYILAQIFYRANDFGLLQAYAFSHSVFPYVRTEVIFDGLTLVAATVFIRRFLRSQAHSVLLDRLNIGIAVIGGVYMLLALFGVPVRYTLVQNFSFFYVPVWLLTGVICWRKGYAPARLFIYAWAAYMVGIVLEAAVDLGLTAQLGIVRESVTDVVLDYIVYLGIALESILLSLSLAQAYRTATAEKERIAQASIRHLRELIEMRERTERMADLAYSDALTHLPNRASFFERVDESLQAATRHGRRCVLLYLDFDRFKVINDTLGHQAGDAALVEAASRLRRTVRGDEIVGRLGGDEFAVFLPEVQREADTEHLIKRIQGAFLEPLVISGQVLALGVSMGTASFPGDGKTRDELIEHADAAMYKNKSRTKALGAGAKGPEPITE